MKKDSKKKEKGSRKRDFIEFVVAAEPASSPVIVKAEPARPESTLPLDTLAPSTKLEDMPPVFRELASPRLPELPRENRARLQMQSPNRLFFYWSIGTNPYQKLNRALGAHTASYSLVLKLVDLKRDTEQIDSAEAEGSSWFDVESDGQYRAEIGFYAPNRPYVRVLFSNTVETPRKGPSPRVDTEADWQVSAERFSRVLEVAGFTEDAFDVALAGDDAEAADADTRSAFAGFIDDDGVDLDGTPSDEIRHALYLIASGSTLDALRWKISPSIFAILQKRAELLSVERALGVLKERFDIHADEVTEETLGPAVFGASAINFPKRLKTRRTLPKLHPVSSAARSVSSGGEWVR